MRISDQPRRSLWDRFPRDHWQSAEDFRRRRLVTQRRASGGVLAPILTHVTWSVTMLCALPALFT